MVALLSFLGKKQFPVGLRPLCQNNRIRWLLAAADDLFDTQKTFAGLDATLGQIDASLKEKSSLVRDLDARLSQTQSALAGREDSIYELRDELAQVRGHGKIITMVIVIRGIASKALLVVCFGLRWVLVLRVRLGVVACL